METRLYELINPSDAITFRAKPDEASFIADRMQAGLYFVKDAETGEDAAAADPDDYDALWRSAERIASYAAAYQSFLVGSLSERKLFEDATRNMTPEDFKAYRDTYHDRRRTSMNDICGQCWRAAENIASYKPEAA